MKNELKTEIQCVHGPNSVDQRDTDNKAEII